MNKLGGINMFGDLKRFSPWLFILLIGSTQAVASARIVESIEASSCKYISEDTCRSKKSKQKKSLEACRKWHKKEASEKGANSVLITDTRVEETKRPMVNGTYKTVKSTNVTASYYNCGEFTTGKAELPPKAKSFELIREKPKSAEQRLKTLNDLLDKGLITKEEYRSKRSEILKDI